MVLHHSPRKRRVVLLEVYVRNQPVHDRSVPQNKRKVGDGHLVPDQILLLREYAVEHPEDSVRTALLSQTCDTCAAETHTPLA